MKKSINAWSIPDDVSFEAMFCQISNAGFDGIELNVDAPGRSSHSLTLDTDTETLQTIANLSKTYNLPVCSISSSLYGDETIGSCSKEGRELGKTILKKQLACAKALGADGILVVPGGITADRSIKQAYENAFQTLSELKDEISSGDIFVGLENVWNGFFISPTDMVAFIDKLDCRNIGAYFDVGNVMIFSFPEYWIEILDKRIGKIHVKDFLRTGWNAGQFVNLLEGNVNWKRVIPALKKAGYDGYLTAEVSALPETPDYLYSSTKLALDIICEL